jgi:biotin transport system ATP-binding protein
MSLIEVRNLVHIFPDGTRALDGISFSLEREDFLVIAGRNGSGKTALMLHLNGLLNPTKGTVCFNGAPVQKDLRLVRQKIGLVFQEPDNQFIGQSVEDDIAFGPNNLGLSPEEISERIEYALETTGLTYMRDRRPYVLSGGEKRRLALAGILAMKPDIIVLDEPFSGLDYGGIQSVLREIVELHHKGHALVVITHEVEKVLAHSTHLIIMEKGTIVGDGNPVDLLYELKKYGITGNAVVNTKIEEMSWLD